MGTAVAALALFSSAHATNGPMPHGYGIKAMGMGGASIALPQDALAAANNPAGMAFVGESPRSGAVRGDRGSQVQLRWHQFNGDGVKAVPVPELGYNRVIDDHQSVGSRSMATA
jgi:long-chain fatty acid transport protein